MVKSLSSSPIWQAQRDYYAQQGVESWRQSVPFYATSNAFIASCYVKSITACMRDLRAKGDQSAVTIVELGAGVGQLSYLLLDQLSRCEGLNADDWRYIMTDAETSLVDFWKSHPGFSHYFESQQLEASVWEIGSEMPSCVMAASEQGLVIYIANYIFDSLPADVYRIQAETIAPVYVALNQSLPIDDFSSLTLSFDIQPEAHIEDPILEQYRQTLLNTTILYPSATLAWLESVKAISPHGYLVLCSDKAYVDLEELDGLSMPEVTPHQGCFSMMVNMHALSEWCHNQGGFFSLPTRRSGLKTMLLAVGLQQCNFPQLITACAAVNQFTPGQYLDIYKHCRLQAAQLSLDTWTSFLGLSGWDPTLFLHGYRTILDQLDGADMLTVNYLLDHLDLIASQAYWLPFYQDIWFMLGVLCHQLKRYHQASRYYQQSLQYYPGVFGVYFNLAICQANCTLRLDAIKNFKLAQELDPADHRVKDWLVRLGDG